MSQTETETLPKADDKTEIIAIDDEDLEDGEIDDSDEEANDNDVVIVATSTTATNESKTSQKQTQKMSDNTGKSVNAVATDFVVTVIDSSSDTAPTPPPSSSLTTNKSKKPSPVDDDYAGSIENALANALKKKGIDPSVPKILENKLQSNDDEGPGPGLGQSKSSRRRKRKKQREEKEKEKERKEKKKRYDTSDPLAPPPFDDEDDMDDYEMLNVRGGSPPPMTALPPAATQSMHMYKDPYNSGSETGSSYDSYDSDCDDSNDERRRRKRKKESRKRKEKRQRDDDKRHDKRSRRDSMDHRQEPRKLELCKFYLLECCAKKDKCSYMHADFPCKYYYLGMECAQKEECKFSHGAPLSEELRNILLKHLETAPKEILGNFKRMTRENALSLVTKRHEELCRTFNIQNVWAPCTASSLPIHSNRRNNNNSNNNNNKNNNDQQQHQLQQLQQQLQQNNSNNTSNIPSLLDMVLNPPPNMENNKANSSNKSSENKRKSRWADNTNSTSHAAANPNPNPLNIEPPSKTAPSYLDLKNLNGILSAEHIEKLSQLGIVNLEQVNQLTFGQLNQIGLTIAEITEIQLNAMNMAKLGVAGVVGASSGSANSSKSLHKATKDNENLAAVNKDTTSSSSNGDIDMRLLPSAQPPTASAAGIGGPDKDVLTSSNSNSNSGGAVVMVDYSQYLKDSNLSFDRGDIYDDEKDDEKLVIDDDDDNTDNEEHNPKSSNLEQQQEEKNRSESYDNGFATKFQSMTDVTQTLRNPFKSADLYSSDKLDLRDPRSGKTQSLANTPEDKEVDKFYAASAATSKRKYSRDSRSRSRTPTRSESNTPEASQSPQPLQMSLDQIPCKDVVYERSSMYDYSSRFAEEDEQRALKTKMDKDMRFLPGMLGSDAAASDVDLRLPFQPMTNYTPATEIDGSITSHLPITYKVYEVEVPRSSYVDLRKHFKTDQPTDPRLRRIFGLPELSQSKTSAALSRKVRKTSHSSIASPSESEDASPKYYTPPSAAEERLKSSSKSARGGDPRGDPRAERADAKSDSRTESRSDPRSDPRADPRRPDPRSAAAATSTTSSSTSNTVTSSNSAGGQKQNIEIRNLLQKSEWYKNLNSKFKIMVNQQLALVSTELKKFHQDSSPTKIFDISFIVNNQTLQQILTNLGIFIDDNGEVAHIDNDNEELTDSLQDFGGNSKSNVNLPNLSQPPPNVGGNIQQNNPTLDFLRAPPPNMVPQGPPPNMALGPMFQRPPMQVSPFARPSLLGLPPGAQGNPLNPFANSLPNMNVNINPNFMGGGGPNMLGPFGPNFNPGMGMPPNMLQRNFNNNNNQRNQRNQNRRKI